MAEVPVKNCIYRDSEKKQIWPINGKANLLQSIQDIVLNRVHRITLPSDSRMKSKFHILYDSYLDSRTNSPEYFFFFALNRL